MVLYQNTPGVTNNYFTHVASYTAKVENFPGLNIYGFGPMKFFAGILSQSIGQHCVLFKYSQETFVIFLKP